MDAENTEVANTIQQPSADIQTETQEQPNTETAKEQQVKQPNINLLYEECLGFILGARNGMQDLRYVYAKFKKDYKNFDYTYDDVLEILKEANLLKYFQVLQVFKPNKSIDIYFRTEDAANFFIEKHIEIRGKPIPFIRKAKKVLEVTIKGVHPVMSNDTLRSELFGYIEHVSSIKHAEVQYKGVAFYDGTRQVYVTHLTEHIPRSIKIGNRGCLVFYRDQPAPPRRSVRVPTIIITPPLTETPTPMESGEPGQGTGAEIMSEVDSEQFETTQQTLVDEPMPEASQTSKRVREPEEVRKT